MSAGAVETSTYGARAGWRPFAIASASPVVFRILKDVLDLSALSIAFLLAYLLRFDFALDALPRSGLWTQLLLVVIVQSVGLVAVGARSIIWRHVGLEETRTFLGAVAGASLPILALRVFLPDSLQAWRVPISVIVIDGVLVFAAVLGMRVLRRTLHEERQKHRRVARFENVERTPTLLVGAGRAGALAAREILGRGDMRLDVKGFVDDDPAKQGATIHGFRVLGTTKDLPRLVEDLRITQVLITIAEISRSEILRIIDLGQKSHVKLRVMPGLFEILTGKVQTTRIGNVRIEDLLGREPVSLDEEQIGAFLSGKVVLVTGAGGSVGSELARQVARFSPAELLLVERAEFALFEIEQQLGRSHPDLKIVPIVADVGEEARVQSIFATHQPHVVLHAAAHKHVPMMEYNPAEAIKNNVLATRLLGEVAAAFGVEAFVLISTDKAVRPTSVMGASKRVAELVVQDLARRYPGRFLAVRFGNVLGSAGSVIPTFREQIRRGGPVTVTHPDMRRYFLTISEAAQLVLQAGSMGKGGEILILDMGNPVRILDLAVAMITLSGLKPFEEMPIVFTGMRPGEKLYEELGFLGEDITKTRHPKIFIGKLATYSTEEVDRALRRLAELARDGHGDAIRMFLNELLPDANLGIRRDSPELGREAEKLSEPEAVTLSR